MSVLLLMPPVFRFRIMPVVKDPTNTTATTTTCTTMVRTTTTTTTHSTTPLTSQTPTSVSLTDISQFYTCQDCFCSRQFTLNEERKTIKISVTSPMTSSETEGRAKVTSEADYSHVPEIVNMVKGTLYIIDIWVSWYIVCIYVFHKYNIIMIIYVLLQTIVHMRT